MEQNCVDYIAINDAHTLHGLFQIRASRQPDDTAYRYFHQPSETWCEYSWRESLEQINRWRKALVGTGLLKGQCVGIMLRNCPEWIFIEQACMAQGYVSVPLYPNDRPDNVAHIIDEAEIKLILIEDMQQWNTLQQANSTSNNSLSIISLKNLNNQMSDNPTSRYFYYEDWLGQHKLETLNDNYKNFKSQDLATIVYTSGTTGRPKGVMLSHWNILSDTNAGIHAITVYKEDSFLSFLPLSHTLERTIGYYLPVMTGASVAFNRSIPQLAEDLLMIKPTVLISVPRIFERVYGKILTQLESKSSFARTLFQLTESIGWDRFEYQQGRSDYSWRFIFWPILNKLVATKLLDKLGGRLRFAISGGAPLPKEISHLFISFGLPIVQGYGLTETSPVISVNRLNNNIPASIGPPLPGIDVRLSDVNELQTRSDCVMSGYWKNESATRDMFTEDGWLKTGDLARIEGKHIFITGRIKEILVLSNGEKVPPVDMEIAVCLHPLFEQAIIVGESKPFLSAIVVLNPGEWENIVKQFSLNSTDPTSLMDTQAKTVILKTLCDCLNDFPGYAQVRQIILSIEPWTDENHFLTPSLKIRRNIILNHFSDEIDKAYDGH